MFKRISIKRKNAYQFGEFKTPIGVVETIKEGTDITLVSYGSTLRLVEQAANEFETVGISVKLLIFNRFYHLILNKDIVKSIAKTNRLLVIDEDVPGGASAYILQEILEESKCLSIFR
jgi:pyruvate/2-oxoglutarate/acetoin dehydrogenase E1 component